MQPNGHKIIKIVLLSILLALVGGFVGSCSSTQSSTVESITEVSFFTTPGKPMMSPYDSQKPAEEIIAKRSGFEYSLTVCINSPADYSTQTARLTQNEWDSIITIVKQYHLIDFVPIPYPQNAIDFGARGFSIQGMKWIERNWGSPLENEDGPTILATMLARLARKRIPQLHLNFL